MDIFAKPLNEIFRKPTFITNPPEKSTRSKRKNVMVVSEIRSKNENLKIIFLKFELIKVLFKKTSS